MIKNVLVASDGSVAPARPQSMISTQVIVTREAFLHHSWSPEIFIGHR